MMKESGKEQKVREEKDNVVKDGKWVLDNYEEIVGMNIERGEGGEIQVKEMVNIKGLIKNAIAKIEGYEEDGGYIRYGRIESDYHKVIEEMVIKDAEFKYRTERLKGYIKEKEREIEKLKEELVELREIKGIEK